MPSPAVAKNVADRSGRAMEDGKNAPAPRVAPFTRGSMKHREPFLDVNTAASAGGGAVNSYDVPSFGYLRGIWLYVQATAGAGAAAVAKEDAPWSALSTIVLADVNGAQIVGPIDGYDLFLINLFGGYAGEDPRYSDAYSQVVATGNFECLLWLPLEICERDGLGALPNQNASSTYKLSFNYGITTNIYSTNPSTLPNVRVRGWLDAWSQPAPTDILGNPQAEVPPAFGTTQFWTRSQFTIAAGDQTTRLTRLGNVIRQIILVFRTTAPARSSTNFPDPSRIQLEGRIVENLGKDLWSHLAYQASAMTGQADDATDPFPVGVYPYSFANDLNGKAGNEMRDLWLPTSMATRLEHVGNFGVAGVLTVLTNDIAPAGDYHLT